MTFTPKSSSNKEKLISLLTAMFAVILIIVSGVTEKFGGLYQISAIILGVISIEFYLKYVGSNYIYEAADDAFKVFKITGKKNICVSCLDYDMSLSFVVSSQEYENNKNEYPKTDFNINLCKNLAPDKYFVYFFRFNGKKCMMKFEPDEMFVDYINEKISSSLKSAQENDNEY